MTSSQITDSVHEAKSHIFIQLQALGRAADEVALYSENPSFPYISASNVSLSQHSIPPRALSGEEINEYIELFATAASNAVHKAGFDGVEIHSANGYLLDQFLQDRSNVRTDEYGGSIEKRAKFVLDIVDAVVSRIGASRTGIRLSPWSYFQGKSVNPTPS